METGTRTHLLLLLVIHHPDSPGFRFLHDVEAGERGDHLRHERPVLHVVHRPPGVPPQFGDHLVKPVHRGIPEQVRHFFAPFFLFTSFVPVVTSVMQAFTAATASVPQEPVSRSIAVREVEIAL